MFYVMLLTSTGSNAPLEFDLLSMFPQIAIASYNDSSEGSPSDLMEFFFVTIGRSTLLNETRCCYFYYSLSSLPSIKMNLHHEPQIFLSLEIFDLYKLIFSKLISIELP